MALVKLQNAIRDNFTDANLENVPAVILSTFIDKYIARQLEKYAENIENGLISFGQYRGRTVSSVLLEPEGKEYLKWCLKSTWLSPTKHKDFIAECAKLGIS